MQFTEPAVSWMKPSAQGKCYWSLMGQVEPGVQAVQVVLPVSDHSPSGQGRTTGVDPECTHLHPAGQMMAMAVP